ncbi:hypothetical protein [Microbacterium sp. SLBN-146]|uniref:hypothetical protein n=1 Tax=Microbacterium sp. SLBN-146 TaxID=2768457 RepID=UPI00114DB350|nr:hypothetical protein [Microbacterium sp. SLBN-146]TQJ31784.1 hypothetical protein FBY39_2266 [Microbacterium sp. SLBN-146]
MSPRIAFAAAALALIALLGGCAPESSPSPSASLSSSPTFTSDAEAFAAAEKTYRAYVDALNDVDLSDPETFEPVFALTTGDANDATKKTFSQMHADGWTVQGETRIDLLERSPGDEGVASGDVMLDVCLNVGDVRLTGPDGESVVSPDRLDVQSMRVELFQSGSLPAYLIASISGREDGTSCAG